MTSEAKSGIPEMMEDPKRFSGGRASSEASHWYRLWSLPAPWASTSKARSPAKRSQGIRRPCSPPVNGLGSPARPD